jgi:LacI family transcriptional regulator
MATDQIRVYLGVQLIQAHFRRIVQGAAAFIRAEKVPWTPMDSWAPLSALGVDRWVKGAILQGGGGAAREQLRALKRPWVQVGATNEPEPDEFAVLPDNRAIGRVAALHFLDRGFREFAFYGTEGHWYSRERMAGFREALAGRPCRVLDRAGRDADWDRELLRFLSQGTALFCANDIFARSAIRHLRESGRAVPEDIAIAGVDDDEIESAQSEIPISSVDPRSEELGWKAAEVLSELLAGRPPANRLTLIPPGPVAVRRSSDIRNIGDPVVAAALSLIRDEACRRLTVAELLRRVPASRRTLERRFHATLGRGIEAEFRRVRLERAKELLASTDLSIGDIADRAGYADIFYFSAAFKKAEGVTPTSWRVAHRAAPRRRRKL